MIHSWIKAKACIVGCVVLAALLLTTFISHCSIQSKLDDTLTTLAECEQHSRELFSDNVTLRNNFTEVFTSLEICNKSIETLDRMAAERVTKTMNELATAKELNRFFTDRILYLQSQSRPANMTACENAKRLIDEEIAARR